MDKTCTFRFTCKCFACNDDSSYGSMSAEEWRVYHGEPVGAKQPAELDNDY